MSSYAGPWLLDPGFTSGRGRLNVRGLFSFRALSDFKLDFLAFLESLEAIHLNCGEVCEKVFTTVVRGNETITFGVVKPFDSTSCHECDLSKMKTENEPVAKGPRFNGCQPSLQMRALQVFSFKSCAKKTAFQKQ